MFSLRFRQADVFANVSSPVLFTLVINYRWCHCYCRCRCYRRLVIAVVIVADVMESMNIQDKGLSSVSRAPEIIYHRNTGTSDDLLPMMSLTPVNTDQLITGVVDTNL
jgi:hypothetical protein